MDYGITTLLFMIFHPHISLKIFTLVVMKSSDIILAHCLCTHTVHSIGAKYYAYSALPTWVEREREWDVSQSTSVYNHTESLHNATSSTEPSLSSSLHTPTLLCVALPATCCIIDSMELVAKYNLLN